MTVEKFLAAHHALTLLLSHREQIMEFLELQYFAEECTSPKDDEPWAPSEYFLARTFNGVQNVDLQPCKPVPNRRSTLLPSNLSSHAMLLIYTGSPAKNISVSRLWVLVYDKRRLIYVYTYNMTISILYGQTRLRTFLPGTRYFGHHNMVLKITASLAKNLCRKPVVSLRYQHHHHRLQLTCLRISAAQKCSTNTVKVPIEFLSEHFPCSKEYQPDDYSQQFDLHLIFLGTEQFIDP